jgi:hypothetical protein
MKLSTIASVILMATANQSTVAHANNNHLRGGAATDSSNHPRNLGLIDNLVEKFTGNKDNDTEKPTLVNDFDGSQGGDLAGIMESLGAFDFSEMMSKMKELRSLLDGLDMEQISGIMSGIDFGNIDTDGFNLEEMIGNMEEIKKLLDGMDFDKIQEIMGNLGLDINLETLLNNPQLLQALLPMLGGLLEESSAKCEIACECDGIFAQLAPDDNCVSVKYIVANEETGEKQERCFPETWADIAVGLVGRYECAV